MAVLKYRKAGGREIVLNNLAVYLNRMGYTISIGAYSFETDPPPNVQKVHLNKIGNMLNSSREINPEVIHSHQTLANYYGLIIKKPFIFHYHGAANRIQELNMKLSFSLLGKRIFRVVSVSNWAASQLNSITGENSDIIYNGVDTHNFNPFLKKPFKKGDPQLLFVGNLYPHKGVDKVVAAMPIVLERFPNSHLIVIGTGKYYPTIKSTIDKMGLEKKVELVGHATLEDLPFYYSSSDIYVSASLFETFDLPSLEAMACAKPILVSDIPAHKEIVEASQAGLFFPPQNIGKFVECMEEVYQQKRTYGNNGRKFAEKHDWSIVSERMSRIYDNVIGKKT
jgi:glycosyltransferase involved in cell wall biosynthesis